LRLAPPKPHRRARPRLLRPAVADARRALRGPEPARPQLLALRRARRRRQPVAAQRHPGQDARPRPAPDARRTARRPRRHAPAHPETRAMSTDLVRYEHRPPAVLLTINRPDKRNALNRALIAALTAAFERARDDPAARCVLLTGAGPAFCAGMDLTELSESIDAERDVVWADALNLARLYDLIYTLPKPTVAVVNGPAVAGGAGLVSVCDLAVAVPDAKFG